MRLRPQPLTEAPATDVIAELVAWAAARPNDNLDASPLMVIRQGSHTVPAVQVQLAPGRRLFMSADTARQAVPKLGGVLRIGAALDLLKACDEAEALSAQLDARTRRAAA